MNNTTRILVLAPDLPYPFKGGGNMRMSSMIDGMSRFAEVHIACIAKELLDTTRAWAEKLGVSIVFHKRKPVSDLALWTHRIKALVNASNLVWYSDEAEFFDEQLAAFKPDLVWLETPYLLRYALAWKGRVPIVVDYWGTSEGQWRDYIYSHGIHRIWQYVRWKTYEGSEKKYLPRIDTVVTVSARDADLLRPKARKTPVRPVLAGMLDSERAENFLDYPEDSNEMVFSGNMSFEPNVDAALYFADEILPLITKECPDAHLKLVGRNPAPAVQALASRPGITVTGAVDDMYEAMASCAVYVLPMRLGSGYRTKLFDVFALGKAIVTTTIGAEGLEMKSGENCIITDSPKGFAAACVALLNDGQARKRLGANIGDTARVHYSQESVVRSIKALFKDLCR